MIRQHTYFLFAYWHEKAWKGFVGATVKIQDMAGNLYNIGHHVVLFCPRCDIDKKSISAEVVEIPLINFPCLRSISFNFLLSLYILNRKFFKKPDVIYLRRTNSIVPLLYAKLSRALFFYEVNDDPFYGLGSNEISFMTRLRRFFSIKIDEINLRSADRIFVISEEIRKKIRKALPVIQNSRFDILESGANTDLFKPGDLLPAKRRVGLDVGNIYICFVGSLLPHQGVDVLIGAAIKILQKKNKCRFLIIGEGPMKRKWMDRAISLGIADKFLFTGQVIYENVPDWICSSDVCVAPYIESSGLRSPVKIFDYLACGRPVIASRIKGTTDIFEETPAVILIEPEQTDRLANAILSVLDDPDYGESIGKSGRDWVKNKYSRSSMARKVSDAANELLAKRGRPKPS